MIQEPTFWLALAACFAVHWLLPQGLRKGFLALASLGVLASLDAVSTVAVTAWTLAFFYLLPTALQRSDQPRRVVSLFVLGVLGFLAYFKYVPVLFSEASRGSGHTSVIVPLGISYYSFKLIHYGVEVARGNIKDRSLSQFAAFMFLFPIFSAGPIERFEHFLSNQDERFDKKSLLEGLTRIAHGLIKKLVLADVFVHAAFGEVQTMSDVLGRFDQLSTGQIWYFCVLSYLYAYLDFSAYSDVAIGSSRLFGIRILENFNWPILASSVRDFWRRWHMTLVGWCQSYVYMPMIGLTRQPYLAVFATFVTMGIWHAGALNWLCWGLYHATAVSIVLTWGRIKRKRRWKYGNRLTRALGIALTFAFVSTSMVFSTAHGHAGVGGSFRVLAKLFFIEP